MPRKERIICPGFYHVISRGVERRNVFLDDEDFNKFLSLLNDVFKGYNVVLHSYCLMTNHYHLLIETKESNISNVMKRINSLYSIYFNKKYKRSGHLWQGRFASYYLYDKYRGQTPFRAFT